MSPLTRLLEEYAADQLRFIKNNLSSPSISIVWAGQSLAHTIFLLHPQLRENNS